ncbi:Surface antigen [Modicisalibacter ilicicola DSM 19980]|uniref:Surface antigen n=1 Tax=Modicisalibacter ilicicola DSM 19980 TaxID=1121942 RepID=A0A1M4W0R4_9GAMM|nr:glycine zipper 2TM domain-containing protein [Halomonas ilicicola]SHE74806.1 Surface antigen [Halomonas ilicicola DSM 19980]
MNAFRWRALARVAIVMLSLVWLGGCQSLSSSPETCRNVSTGFGALVGGLFGSQVGDGSGRTAAMVIGAGLGAFIGREVGTRFTCEDRKAMDAVLDTTPDGKSQDWHNPRTGNRFIVTPQNTFQRDGQECRAYQMDVIVDGELRQADGTACRRQEDDAWTTV